MQGLGFLIAAYGAVGVGLLGYVGWLVLRTTRVRREIALLSGESRDGAGS